MIVYVSIGNSDDKLTHAEWAEYVRLADYLLGPEPRFVAHRHGAWFSAPASPFVNACWCVEFDHGSSEEAVKVGLRALAAKFRQDSIAWAVADTEFLEPLRETGEHA